MNNEEKILAMLEKMDERQNRMDERQGRTEAILEKMDGRLDKLEQGQSEMRGDIQGLKTGQAKLEQGQSSMQGDITSMQGDVTDIKQRVLSIEVTLENQIAPNIRLLAEGHSGIVDKLKDFDILIAKVDDVQDTVDVLKQVAREKN